jgi:L-threonylcarbamoyladenylate synthase
MADGDDGGREVEQARGDELQQAIDAIRAGLPVLLPTDGVYGLCAAADRAPPALRLQELKGRDAGRPIALLAPSVDALLESIPELDARDRAIVRALFPGPYTLVVSNPAQRYPWLNPVRPDTIGVRVARLPSVTQRVLEAAGAVAATSANASGEPAAASLEAVPAEIRAACGAELDAGELPGVASTVIDFTGAEPVVLREGAAPAAEAIACAEAALAR